MSTETLYRGPHATEARQVLGPLLDGHGVPLLAGVVGSTAYGLATPESDRDRLAVFAAPTEVLFGLAQPQESLVTHTPSDAAAHEAAKMARLLLATNPTVTELLWLPEQDLEVCSPLGQDLLGLRRAFLSARRVKDAYCGYARAQFKRLEQRGDGTFSSDTRKRSAKHARHCMRLFEQGLALYETGELTVRVADPERLFAYGEMGTDDLLGHVQRMQDRFESARTVLPEEPDVAAVQDWLVRVRRAHLAPAA